MKQRLAALALSLVLISGITVAPSYAYHQGYAHSSTQSELRSLVKPALIGAGLGAVAGGVLSRNDRKGGIIKGAVVGAVAGGGYGFLRNRGYLNGMGNLNPFRNRAAYNPNSNGYSPYGY